MNYQIKIALLLSGYLRSFNYKNLKEKLLDRYDVDVYLHISSDENTSDKYFNKHNDLNDIIHLLKPITMLYEKDMVKNSTVSMWNKIYKLNTMKSQREQQLGITYDIVIRCRPDIFIVDDIDFNSFNFKDEIVYIPDESIIDKGKLKYATDNSICDIFAFGNSKIMNQYCSLYEYINCYINLNYSLVSETLLYEHLKYHHIITNSIHLNYKVILSLCNVIAISGDSGSGKSTILDLLEQLFVNNSLKFECDRYHKWERHDDNWIQYTHLNPEANYLMKLRKDVFDLKIGNDIYQVDYNHTTGKFTNKELIQSKNNIIICGLHTLFDDQLTDSIDIKIFIDTQEELKTIWKIKRDMKKRNHSIEHILNQIKTRHHDYVTYILPQKQYADIVINYYTDDILDMNNIDIDIDIEPKLKLNIYIKKHYNISNIIYVYKSLDPTFIYNIDKDYHICSFINPHIQINNLKDFFHPKVKSIIKDGYNGIIQCFILDVILHNKPTYKDN